jgi:hypothetical protein
MWPGNGQAWIFVDVWQHHVMLPTKTWIVHLRRIRSLRECSTNVPQQELAAYGGRRIGKLCPVKFRFTDFAACYKELGAMPEPKKDYSLDRINPFGDYAAKNVRRLPRKLQAMNTRKQHQKQEVN